MENFSNSTVAERGAIYTRSEVVEFILDLVGYNSYKPLYQFRLLEPSFGNGDFLLPAVQRLLASWKTSGLGWESLKCCIIAVELHRATFEKTATSLAAVLSNAGISEAACAILLNSWLVRGDFLLEEITDNFHFVVGNPPYIRQEAIPALLIAEYRSRYKTIFDRADIYIPFIERSLSLLTAGGQLGFICADRWVKNRYGGPLRQIVANGFHLKFYIDMGNVSAFDSDVVAYPAITVIVNEPPGSTRVARQAPADREALSELAAAMTGSSIDEDRSIAEIDQVTDGSEPWILETPDKLAIVRRLEPAFPTLEESGCKVGIGVATGADSVFIASYEKLEIEPDRKLPLVMTRDIASGAVKWRGLGVINPFQDDGGLVDLRDYPRLAAYLGNHEQAIRRRHVSQRRPTDWYRTIDRITPSLAQTPKLLIPDIKGEPHIVYEAGRFYPHHNLYYIVSDVWDLRALQAVLLSGIAKLFVAAYSTKMRGGYLRFQAQYLRRIRLPHWEDVSTETRVTLVANAGSAESRECRQAVAALYRISAAQQRALGWGD